MKKLIIFLLLCSPCWGMTLDNPVIYTGQGASGQVLTLQTGGTSLWQTPSSSGSGVPTTRLINTTQPILGGGDLSADRTISIQQATSTASGYITVADWNTFNNKQNPLDTTKFVPYSNATGTVALGNFQLYASGLFSTGSVVATNTASAPIVVATNYASANTLYLNGGSTKFIPLSMDIQTAINNSQAGDTLVLAAGTYTITSGITVNKLLHIMGQGAGITTITCATDNVNMITMASAGAVLSDMTVSRSGAITAERDNILVTASCDIYNLQLIDTTTSAATGSHLIINRTAAATINVENCTFSATGATGYHDALDVRVAGTILNARNCYALLSGGTLATGGALAVHLTNGTINLYNCSISNTSNTAVGVLNTAGGTLNAYNCVANGSGAAAFDARNASGTLTLYNTTLVNNKTSGTITYSGTVVTDNLFANSNISASAQVQATGGVVAGGMILKTGSITDSSGTISFSNENLTTTGTSTSAVLYLTASTPSTITNRFNINTSPTVGNASGISLNSAVGENVSFGDVLYFNSGQYFKALGASGAKVPVMGMALSAISANSTGPILMCGTVTNSSWNFYTSSSIVYLSPTISGGITQTIPSTTGQQVEILGYAITGNTMYFNPDYTYVEI